MISRSFRLQIIVRIAILALSLGAAIALALETQLYATAALAALLAAVQTWSLVRFVERTNLELTRFLRSVRYADFSQSFSSKGRGRSFDELNAAFTEVVDAFQKARADKEEHAQYFQMVVQHIGIGLIAFTPEGEVTLFNTAAKRLLQMPQLRTLDGLTALGADLAGTLRSMRSGDRSFVQVEVGGEQLQLLVYAREMKLRERHMTLLSIQNIRTELDEKEIEAWQKLIRVLTHEIMNSITPISSLASTVRGMLADGPRDGAWTPESARDIRSAIETIEKRSQGLLHFVEAYRRLMRTPSPVFRIVRVSELFERVGRLMESRFKESGVSFSAHVEPESLELTADPELIEQVLINLLVNALEAAHGQGEKTIRLVGRMGDQGRVFVEVSDNGPGIPKEVQDKLFIPLFTTKPNGSGIGLSLSRQIMRLHRGSISVRSEPGVATTFVLRF